MEKISIIVPIYNCEKFLDKCLKSIINQTYKNLEIILVNDGSADNSLKIIKKYAKIDKRIKVIDKKNEGVSLSRNRGIRESTGKYITFVDADDYLDDTMIERMYETIKKEKVEAVRINYKVHYKDTTETDTGNLENIGNKLYQKEELKEIVLKKILDGTMHSFVYLLMIDREALLKTKLFKTDIHMMEDVILYVELMLSLNNLYILDEALYNIFFNEESATNNKKNYERNILNVLLVNDYIKKILKKSKLDNSDNLIKLNTANAIAISDFIFKNYLSGYNTIDICKKISNDNIMKEILINIDYSYINQQRKFILKFIENKQFILLRIFFIIRKILRKIKK